MVCVELDVGGASTGVTVSATDDDGPVYGAVTYSISDTLPQLYFQVTYGPCLAL